jgi:archaetidylinositol phosphate synthase
MASSDRAAQGFREAERHLAGVTARAEKRALAWLAPRVPPRVTSDHLTLLGFASTAACGALYAASGRWPWLVLLVNVGLALNWLGDSLDGTLARHRGSSGPASASTSTTCSTPSGRSSCSAASPCRAS